MVDDTTAEESSPSDEAPKIIEKPGIETTLAEQAGNVTTDEANAEESDGPGREGGRRQTRHRRSQWPRSRWLPVPSARAAATVTMVVALGALCGWLGMHAYAQHHTEKQREVFLAVAKQGALDLTTIDYAHVEADIQRILDRATGTFYEDFKQQAEPFIATVQEAKSTSVGTVSDAGVETQAANQAQVLVAVSVKTSNISAENQPLRAWRMRLTINDLAGGPKISNVEFVP